MKWLMIGLIGALSFLTYMLISAPASLMISMIEEDLARDIPDLALGRTTGSLWNGAQELQYQNFPALLLNWELSALPLIASRIESQNLLTGEGLEANFFLSVNDTQGSLNQATATINSQYLNQVTVPLGLDLSETFSITGLDVTWENNWVTSITGEMNWPGGIVHIETPQALHTVKLPALRGSLAMDAGAVHLQLADADTVLMDIRLKSDGWAEVAIQESLIAMTGIPFPAGLQDGDGPALLLEEKIL